MVKISNLLLKDNVLLLDLAMVSFYNKIDKISANNWKGTFSFKFLHVSPLNKNINKEYKITVKFEKRNDYHLLGSMRGNEFSKNIIIYINRAHITNIQDVIDTYIHEMTHVSQIFNGALLYSNSMIKNLNNTNHHLCKCEQEAVLSTILYQLKENKLIEASIYFNNRKNYFINISKNSILKKAISFGVEKNIIIEFINKLSL